MGLRLNVGCGPLRYDGEIGVDRYPVVGADVIADLMALPFPDGSAEFVRLDHVLEHLPGRMAVPALFEAARVLEQGGALRVGLTDLAATCREYIEAERLEDKALVMRHLFGSQIHPGEYHQSGWDGETLRDLLGCCGFRVKAIGLDPDRADGVCIAAEAVKP